MRRVNVLAFVLMSVVAASLVRADPPSIKVHKDPVKVMHQTFDLRHLPPKMPPLVPGEAGLCHYEFTTDIQVGGDTDTIGPGEVNITVDTAEINLSLPITIFLEPNAPKRILEHEEGHRSICEYYYANIDVYAKRAAQKQMGKTFNGKGANKQAAVDNALTKCMDAIREEILANTRVRAVACNDRYDKITDHSRNPGVQLEAAAKAESDDPEPPGGRLAGPATQPTASAN